jgi:hypothetical protein
VVNPGKPCQDLALGEDTGVIEPEFIEVWQWRRDCRASGGGESRDQRDVFLCRDLSKSYRVHRLRKAETRRARKASDQTLLPLPSDWTQSIHAGNPKRVEFI